MVFVANLPALKDRLRTTQCQDSLEALRHVLTVKTRMIQFKNKNTQGQREGTHSQTIIDHVHNWARNFAKKYHAAREVKYRLVGAGAWEDSFRVLLDRDIRVYLDVGPKRLHGPRRGTREDDELAQAGMEEDWEGSVDGLGELNLLPEVQKKRDGTGKTRKEISWIWQTGRHPVEADKADPPDEHKILQSEWAKS